MRQCAILQYGNCYRVALRRCEIVFLYCQRGAGGKEWETKMAVDGSMVDDPYVLQANLDNTMKKIMELEAQIETQEQEVSRLEMISTETERLQSMESDLVRISELEILSTSNEFLEVRITTHVPTMQTTSPNHKIKYEHELVIKLDTTAMAVEAVQLTPEDVPYEDLVAEAKALSVLHVAPLLVNGGEGWSKQIPMLVTRIRHRIYANALRNATLSVSAKDPRYKLKYSPEANLIIATLPGHFTANIATPCGWPMQGFTLLLNSLVPSAKASDLNPSGILQQCVDLANSSSETQKSDILRFLQEIEKIYVAKRREALNHQ